MQEPRGAWLMTALVKVKPNTHTEKAFDRFGAQELFRHFTSSFFQDACASNDVVFVNLSSMKM